MSILEPRWNAKQAQAEQVATHFAQVPAVVAAIKKQGLCKETLPNLEQSLQGHLLVGSDLQLELAARMDAGAPFAKITKQLEGSGFLAPFVVYYTMELRQIVSSVVLAQDADGALPNVAALLRKLPDHMNKRAKWGQVKALLKPGFDYGWKVMGGGGVDEEGGKYSMDIFKFAQLFHPSQSNALLVESGRIDFEDLTALPDVQRFLGDALCRELVGDADKLMKCHRAHLDKWLNPEELLQYWKEHQSEMGSWAGAARKVALLLPNSCLAERAGSIVRSRISDQQGAMLDETFETYCRLAFRYAEERDGKKKKKKMKSQAI